MNKKKELFNSPCGHSDHLWNNTHTGTTASVTCQACGTEHGELNTFESSRIIDQLFGLQIVEECCGKAIDILYAELGREFFEKFLNDYAEDALNPRFFFVGQQINQVLDKINKKALELAKTSSETRAIIRP